jgi:N-acyl-D-amino-acid deacylase
VVLGLATVGLGDDRLIGQVTAQTYDLVLRGGRVIDGTGGPAVHGDVAISQGRIVAVARHVSGSGRREIDVTGRIVAPGFIDVHTHAEEIVEHPRAENFLRMGVTTLVLGNCGSSTLDVDGFFRKLEATNISANVATLIGHGSVRNQVMGGSFMRPPSDGELAEMKAMVERAMRDGAVGLSTGLIYLPGTFARTEELIELMKVSARHDGIYASHMRDEGRGILESLAELFRIAREANCRAEISHLKLSGPASWGRAKEVLAAIDRARAEGLDITQDQYLYTASSTSLSQLIPDEWREGGKFKENLADPVRKARMMEQMRATLAKNGRTNFAYAVIANCKSDPALNGQNVVEAAQFRRRSAALDDQMEMILAIHAAGGASAIFHGISEEDLTTFLHHPNTMLGSDSGVRQFGEGVPHPRGYGNAARLLARYVEDQHQLRLEEAIRRMTCLPAATFRLKDRGQIREGAWADMVVFAPREVRDKAEFMKPHQYAEGFALVLVNGVVVVEDDLHTGARPGRALRRLSE